MVQADFFQLPQRQLRLQLLRGVIVVVSQTPFNLKLKLNLISPNLKLGARKQTYPSYGTRAHSEWHYLQQDLERGIKNSTLKVRPQFLRISFKDLKEALDWAT